MRHAPKGRGGGAGSLPKYINIMLRRAKAADTRLLPNASIVEHTTRTLSLFRSHDQGCIVSEALHVFLVQGLRVAGAVEVLHECHDGSTAGWRAGIVVSDLVRHCVFEDIC